MIKVTVTRGTTTITDYELTLTRLGDRPTTGWAPPTTIGTDKGYLLPGTLEQGAYLLWARVAASPELAVIPIQRIDAT